METKIFGWLKPKLDGSWVCPSQAQVECRNAGGLWHKLGTTVLCASASLNLQQGWEMCAGLQRDAVKLLSANLS